MRLINEIYFVSRYYIQLCALLASVLVTYPTFAKDSDILISAEAAKITLDQNVLSVAAAERIAKHCVLYAEELDKQVGIYILSPSGTVIFAYSMDGQSKVVVESAHRKAQSVLDMRMSTHMIESLPESLHPGLYDLGQFPFRGGLPIMLGNQMIGSIGVGGMSGEQDEACAHQAITSVVGSQPPVINNQ